MSVEAQIQTHKEFKFTLTLREVKSDDDGVGIGSKQKAKLSFRASIMSVDGRPIGVCKGKERIGYPDERLPVRRFLDARIDSLRDMEVILHVDILPLALMGFVDVTMPDPLSFLCAIPIDSREERPGEWALDFGTKALSLELDAEQVSCFSGTSCSCRRMVSAASAKHPDPAFENDGAW